MKKWDIKYKVQSTKYKVEELIKELLKNRSITTEKQKKEFLIPPNPFSLTPADVGIEKASLDKALKRIIKAIKNKESIVVYADYDADGITAGAIMWETLHGLSANVMPYIPHRA